MGAPTTAAVTAAKPATGNRCGTVANPTAAINLLIKPPAAAPIIAAGEKTPPNNPKPIHKDVASNFKTNNKNRNPRA